MIKYSSDKQTFQAGVRVPRGSDARSVLDGGDGSDGMRLLDDAERIKYNAGNGLRINTFAHEPLIV